MIKTFFLCLYALFIYSFPADASCSTSGKLEESPEIEQLIRAWNDAINRQQLEKLTNLYAVRVTYYLNDFSSKQCIDSKAAWISKHSDYKQQVRNIRLTRIYKGKRTVVSADFTKAYSSNGKSATSKAYLEFEDTGSGWKIVKESDDASESKRLKNNAALTLPKGEYSFSGGIYIDTENEQGDLSYNLLLNIGDRITGSYNFWSYVTRTTFSYTITRATMKDGLLEISLLFEGESGETYEDGEAQARNEETVFRFKILNGNELFELEHAIPVSLFPD